jgi:hypothetical protein
LARPIIKQIVEQQARPAFVRGMVCGMARQRVFKIPVVAQVLILLAKACGAEASERWVLSIGKLLVRWILLS